MNYVFDLDEHYIDALTKLYYEKIGCERDLGLKAADNLVRFRIPFLTIFVCRYFHFLNCNKLSVSCFYALMKNYSGGGSRSLRSAGTRHDATACCIQKFGHFTGRT